jgi:putative ABC transport system permease protein
MNRAWLRLYGVLLCLYPPGLRRAYGAEMRRCARDAVADGGAAALPRLFLDFAISVPREWLLLLGGFSMIGLGRDAAYAMRLLWRSPGFSAAAILTLALGIGTNTAIYTLADATIIRPLRVVDMDRLVSFKWSASLPDYREWTAQTDLLTGVDTIAYIRMTLTMDGVAEPIDAALVSPNYFTVLGVDTSAGRPLGAADAKRGGDLTAVVAREWWRTRLQSDPAAVGSTIHVSGTPVTIVGIAADGFRGTSLTRTPQIYLPLEAATRLLPSPFNSPAARENRGFSWVSSIGRLRPGVSMAGAADAMDAMYVQQHPGAGSQRDRLELVTMRARVVGATGANSVYTFVGLLAGVVVLTLLTGCANVANLQLARAAARRREIGVRLAIGASPARIFRQVLTESVVVGGLGGVFGLFVASLSLRLMARYQLPGGIDIDGLPLAVDGTALAFAMLVSAVTVLLSGLQPAWQAARVSSLATLRGESRVSARNRARSALVAVQIALSLVLVIGTALFLQSFAAALRVPLGFNPAGVATTTLTPDAKGFDRVRAAQFSTPRSTGCIGSGRHRRRVDQHPADQRIDVDVGDDRGPREAGRQGSGVLRCERRPRGLRGRRRDCFAAGRSRRATGRARRSSASSTRPRRDSSGAAAIQSADGLQSTTRTRSTSSASSKMRRSGRSTKRRRRSSTRRSRSPPVPSRWTVERCWCVRPASCARSFPRCTTSFAQRIAAPLTRSRRSSGRCAGW